MKPEQCEQISRLFHAALAHTELFSLRSVSWGDIPSAGPSELLCLSRGRYCAQAIWTD